MTDKRLCLLYLCNAFPPGVTARFPSVNPAGHAQDTRIAQAIGKLAAVSTVGLLPGDVFGCLEPKDDSLGLDHELVLWERKPELWHRWRSWRRLRRFYLEKVAKDGPPDAVLARNLSPVFNRFVCWLRRQRTRPLVVLLLADSSILGKEVSWSRRLRYALKPMQTLDARAVLWYDACIALGIRTRRYFEPRGVPWLWMPSAFNFRYDPLPPAPAQTGPIQFGYFGSLAEHAAVLPTVRVFLGAQVPGELHMCGFGRQSGELEALAARHPKFRFDGLLQNQADCLAWAQKLDVLLNPRLEGWGLENSFPSKIFEYAMTGKAILSTRTGGADQVLREEGFYLDTADFENSLRQKLREIAGMDRAELRRRGKAIRNRVLKEFSWDEQGRRMVEFLAGIIASHRVAQPARVQSFPLAQGGQAPESPSA
jgi:glycosyltransferase involved in cell wall biosynthesis